MGLCSCRLPSIRGSVTTLFPDTFETERPWLRPIGRNDAQAVFSADAQDGEVTRRPTCRPHATLAETEAYVAACAASAGS